MKKIFILFPLGIIALLLIAGWYYLNTPFDRMGRPRIINIPRGSSYQDIARILAREGVIGSPGKFILLGKIKGITTRVKAGHYRLSPALTPLEIARKLATGETFHHKVTVPEGYNIYQIARLLETEGLTSKASFLTTAQSPALLSSLGIRARGVEGYLFPDTYYFPAKADAEQIIRTMINRFEEVFTPEMESRGGEIGMTRAQVVTLASIVEKETALSAEREQISAVFHNRLKKRIPLQSDPTVIYGMGEGFRGNLSKEDLKRKTPYNTYTFYGLPPGPICNPGRDSLLATLYPADVSYLYFVSRNDGSHLFSQTLEEHNRAVFRYHKSRPRRIE